MEETKIVVYKDGTWTVVENGVTWEYENDKDWLVTISIAQIEKEISKPENEYKIPFENEVLQALDKLTIITSTTPSPLN
jgi:hypothetical protein